jgi:oligoribonuclease NrnB/cAMP/cGMP phosphodiesterase (DHH superfamily)
MVNTKRILSITHEQDVDGLFCGAILKNSFPDTLVFLTNYGQENMKRVSEIIKFNISRSTKTGTVVISDLGIDNRSDLEPIEEAAYRSKNYGWDFVWLDHHSWDKEIKLKVESFATLILSDDNNSKEKKCASELVVQQFASNRTACQRMGIFAHIVDFRLPKVRTLPPLPELITYYRSLPDSYNKLHLIVNKASKGIFWDEELQEEYETKYLPLKESAMSSTMKSLSIHDINGLMVGIAESPRILPKSLLSEKIFEEKPWVKLVVLYSPDGRVSIRRKPETSIKCDRIAHKMSGGEGGGHSYAAAGMIKNTNDEALKLSTIVQELQKSLETYE